MSMATDFIWILMVPNGWHSSLKLNKRTPTLSMIPGAGVFDYSCFLNRLPIIQL